MVETWFQAVHILTRIIVSRISLIKGVVSLTPDLLPEVELIGSPGLKGLVVDGQLEGVSRAEHVRFAATVYAGFTMPLDRVDTRDVTHFSRAAMHTSNRISRRRPALNVQGNMNRALIGFSLRQHITRQRIHHALQIIRCRRHQQMRGNLNFQVRPVVIIRNIEILDQQDQAKVTVLELELIARITPYPPGMPHVTSKTDNSGDLEQIQHTRLNPSPVQLADSIDPAMQDLHPRQVRYLACLWANENAPPWVDLTIKIDPFLEYWFRHNEPLTMI